MTQFSTDSKTAIILVAHGTRNPDDSRVLWQYQEKLSDALQTAVYVGFEEFLSPSTNDAVAHAVADGFLKLKVLPYFLFESSHIKQKLTEALERLRETWPHVEISRCGAVGYDDRMVEILKDRASAIGP
ncbi:MAG: CbiX/SirB N-terminal domain-containing protein [SAR324 cluster bacterium]|nr:CbiX/SirB N-terminal domain-containing protein [SAR324 cluster bacterium]